MPAKAAKPVYATVEEVNEAKQEVIDLVDDTRNKAATKNALKEAVEKIDSDIAATNQLVADNKEVAREHSERVEADLRAYADEHGVKVRAEYDPQHAEHEARRAMTQATLENTIAAVDEKLNADYLARFAKLSEEVQKQFEELEARTKVLVEERRVEAAKNLAEQRSILDDLREQESRRVDREIQLVRKETAAEFNRREEIYFKVNREQDATLVQNRKELDQCVSDLWDEINKNKVFAAEETEQLRIKAAADLEAERVILQRHLEEIDFELIRIWDMYRELQEIPTRRVEWILPRASELAAPAIGDEAEYKSYFSQKFRAVGTRNIRMELRLYRPDVRGPGGSGDCSMVLWCGRGMHLHVRMFVEDMWAVMERQYTQRGPEESKKICFFKDHIRDDGTVRLGVEFLEAIHELEDDSPLLTNADCEEPLAEGEPPDGGGEEGRLLFHRHINHRVVPQIRKELERMQARLVRRVEWHVENAAKLQSYFAAREAICSPVFNVAGMEGLQLVFYPSGYQGATDGFCSLYLYCPAGITVRCTLSVGNQTRDAHNTFVEAGAYGRANFCMYNGTWDKQTDTLTIAFEIVDIKQELSATSSHATKPAPDGTERGDLGGAVKMLRVPGRESLTETKVLPALWTAKSLGDMQARADGFNVFEDMKTKRVGADLATLNPLRPPQPFAYQSQAAAEAAVAAGTLNRSESSPALSPPMSPATGELGSLPMLKTGGLAGLSGPFVGQRRAPRRLRSAPGAPPAPAAGPLGTMPIPTHVPGLT